MDYQLALLALPEAEQALLDADTRYLVEVYPFLPMIRDLEFATVISGNHIDPESWKAWTDKEKQDASITRFTRRLASKKTDKTDPLVILIVTNMLLTGFDVLRFEHRPQLHD